MKIFVTGGSGFLGHALLKYWGDNEFTIYSRDEHKQAIMKRQYPEARYILGDVRDVDRMSLAMHGCDLVVHTAAIKFIPEAEYNVHECIDVNVGGSRLVLEACRVSGDPKVVGISTDKAVQPVNTYGASKMLMERMFDEAAKYGQRASLVRYGNVVGSTGSVIPLFKYQLQKDGFITLTDPTMTRFWLSPLEAVDLIRLAVASPPGTIVLPKAGAMSMGALAEAMADDNVKVVGHRPGEKKHEQMLHVYESIRTIEFSNHYLVNPIGSDSCGNEFTVWSNDPDYWVSRDELLQYIEEAEALT